MGSGTGRSEGSEHSEWVVVLCGQQLQKEGILNEGGNTLTRRARDWETTYSCPQVAEVCMSKQLLTQTVSREAESSKTTCRVLPALIFHLLHRDPGDF